jgi:hypothetical protein
MPIVPYKQEEVKADILSRFQNSGYSSTFEGSNVNVLADILAYITSMLNINTSFNISEMLLTRATQRKNILYLAREQGYEAQNKISYQYKITLIAKKDETLADNDTTLRVYEIPKYFSITSGSYSYYYFGDTLTRQLSNNMITSGDSNMYFTIIVKEGILYKYSDYPDILISTTPTTYDTKGNIVVDNKIQVPYTSVEDDGIEMYLTYIDEDGIEHVNEPWYKSIQFLSDKDTNLTKKFVRLENIETGTPQLYFNIASVGNTLRLNTTIKLNILISSGANGIKETEWNITDSTINSNFVFYTGSDVDLAETLLIIGTNEESYTSVQENAPLFHNSANRAVTKDDYISICNRFSVVNKTQCWGGDEENPVKLGHVYLSFIPSYAASTYTNDTLKYNFNIVDGYNKEKLFIRYNELQSQSYDENNTLINPGIFDILNDYKIMTLQLHNVYPFYMDFDYTVNIVRYSLTRSKQDTHQSVFDISKTFFENHVNDFNNQYFHSNLIKRIDTDLIDLSGVNINVFPKINIFSKNINEYFTTKRTEMNCTFYLGMPYEYLYDDVDIKDNVLPSLNTNNFIEAGDLLFVDFNTIYLNPDALNAKNSEYFYYDIKYTKEGITKICGRYYIDNGARKYIKIDLYINEDGSLPEDSRFIETPLTNIMFSTPKKLNINYLTNNFRLYKHMFPRLTSMIFN